MITLDEQLNTEETLNVFKLDENYEENESKYKEIIKDILDEGSSDLDGEDGDSGSEEESDAEEEEEEKEKNCNPEC